MINLKVGNFLLAKINVSRVCYDRATNFPVFSNLTPMHLSEVRSSIYLSGFEALFSELPGNTLHYSRYLSSEQPDRVV